MNTGERITGGGSEERFESGPMEDVWRLGATYYEYPKDDVRVAMNVVSRFSAPASRITGTIKPLVEVYKVDADGHWQDKVTGLLLGMSADRAGNGIVPQIPAWGTEVPPLAIEVINTNGDLAIVVICDPLDRAKP